jgi:hypothetical protein
MGVQNASNRWVARRKWIIRVSRSFSRRPGDANGRPRTIWTSKMHRPIGDALIHHILCTTITLMAAADFLPSF